MQKLHRRASVSQWILGWFDFLQNEFEMGLAKTFNWEGEGSINTAYPLM